MAASLVHSFCYHTQLWNEVRTFFWKWVFTHESLIEWIFAFYNWAFVNLKFGYTYIFSPLLPGQHELFKCGIHFRYPLMEKQLGNPEIHHKAASLFLWKVCLISKLKELNLQHYLIYIKHNANMIKGTFKFTTSICFIQLHYLNCKSYHVFQDIPIKGFIKKHKCEL